MRKNTLTSLIILGLFVLCSFLVVGCGCSEDDTTSAFGPHCGDEVEEGIDPDDPDGGASGGRLLVTDLANSNIRTFTGVKTLESKTETSQPLSGQLTQLTRPNYLSIHPQTEELIVPDEGTSAVLFFDDIDKLNGNYPPTRSLRGPATELVGPTQCFVDVSTDELYVLDRGTSTILVFANASEIEGEIAPSRRIGGGVTGISGPTAFFFRIGSEKLSVVNRDEILTFDNFRSLNGAPAPSGRFGGPATTFSNVTYAFLTGDAELIVVDSGTDRLMFFESFDDDQWNQAPDRIVSGGNTGITEPRQFELVGDTLYIANGGEVLVFDKVSEIEGNPFPNRRFSGLNPNTQTLHGLLFF